MKDWLHQGPVETMNLKRSRDARGCWRLEHAHVKYNSQMREIDFDARESKIENQNCHSHQIAGPGLTTKHTHHNTG